MSNFSKIAIGSSLVLSAVLFSIGCGGNDMCCKDTGEPPIPKIADAGNQGVPFSDGQYTLSNGNYNLKLNGIDSSVDTDGGQVVKCNWYIADEGEDKYAKNKKLVVKDKCQNVEIDFSKYPNGTKKLVCLEVIDNNGLSSKLNNGGVADFNANGEIRKGAGAIEDRKRLDCRRVTVVKTPAPDPLKIGFDIYNGRTNNPATQDKVKQGCPFYLKTDTELPNDASCKWTIDGTVVSTSCDNVTGQSFDDLNEHNICLAVNGEDAKCTNFKVSAHDAPTPVIGIYDDESLTIAHSGHFAANDSIFLTCKDSKNDCPGDNKGLECKWEAQSYEPKNGSCEYEPQENDFIYPDCFNKNIKQADGSYKLEHIDPITSAAGDIVTRITTRQEVCESAMSKCVRVRVKVTDKRYTPNASKTSDWSFYKIN